MMARIIRTASFKSVLKRIPLVSRCQYTTKAMQQNPFTRYYHPGLEIQNGVHDQGLFCTTDIPMGSILLIEDGLYDLDNGSGYTEIQKNSQNQNIRAIMDTLVYNENAKHIYDSDDPDIQRFIINAITGNIYPFACKINHGYPTNVAIFRSYARHEYNKIHTDQAIVVATDDIPKYSELQYDYFNIVFVNEEDENSLNDYNNARKTHSEIEINENIENDFVKSDGAHNIYKQKGGPIDKRTISKIFDEIYLNGISNVGLFRDMDILPKAKHDIIRIFALEVAMQQRKYAGFFTQIGQSDVDPSTYNSIIDELQHKSANMGALLDFLCATYSIKID